MGRRRGNREDEDGRIELDYVTNILRESPMIEPAERQPPIVTAVSLRLRAWYHDHNSDCCDARQAICIGLSVLSLYRHAQQ